MKTLAAGFFALLAALASHRTAFAACPATAADLVGTVNAAGIAFSAMDAGTFQAARDEALAMVGCLVEVVAPTDAAAFHRMEGYAAFIALDDGRARTSFRASALIQPGYALPSTVAPEGSPLAALYSAASAPAPEVLPATAIATGVQAWVDGSQATGLDPGRPALLQVLEPTGTVAWSGYLHPGDEPPALLFVAVESRTQPTVEAPPLAAAPRRRTGRLIALAGTGVTAAVLGGVAADAWGAYRNAQEECSTRTADDVCSPATLALKSVNHDKAVGFGAAAGVAAALGLGIGISLAF